MKQALPASGMAPLTSSERIGELDVLRGFALVGVLLVNLVFFSFTAYGSTSAQRASFLADPSNMQALFWVAVLAGNKANTLFATLFGIGFWVQMERLQARSGPFERLYLRRLTLLLLMGIANGLLLWPWDILHMYALMGFLLFFLRKVSLRTMLLLGLLLALASQPAVEWWREANGLDLLPKSTVHSDAGVIARQGAYLGNDYPAFVGAMIDVYRDDYFSSFFFLAFWPYVLGRFLLGAWLARKKWLSQLDRLLPQIRLLSLSLPLGFALEYYAMSITFGGIDGNETVEKIVNAFGIALMALGYACLLILLYHSRLRQLVLPLAAVGRMALTNYIGQSLLIFLLLSDFGPGLGLIGAISPLQAVAYSLGFFLCQILFSWLWLKAFRFGPLEYLWRWGTYGKRPGMRRQPAMLR